MADSPKRSLKDRRSRIEKRRKESGLSAYFGVILLAVVVGLVIASIFYRNNQQERLGLEGGITTDEPKLTSNQMKLTFEIDEGDSQRVLEKKVKDGLKEKGAGGVMVKLVKNPFNISTRYFFVPSKRYDSTELQNAAIEYGTDINLPLPKRLDVRITIGKDIEPHLAYARAHKVSLTRDTTVEVLNGSGIPGKASELKILLEARGFKVLAIRNAEKDDYILTQIHVGEGNLEVAEPLRQLLDIASENVKEDLPDCVIVLGEDYGG